MDKKDLISLIDSQVLFDLATIHTFVASRETTKSIQSYTVEHYLEQAKNQIKSDTKGDRPTKLDRLDRIKNLVDSTIDKVKDFNDDLKDSDESRRDL